MSKIEEPKPTFLTRYVLGPFVIFTSIVTPLLLLVEPGKDRSPVVMGIIATVGVLFGLGSMWPRRLSWARRAGIGGIGVLLMWMAFFIWSGVQNMEGVTDSMRLESFGVFIMPSCVAAVTLFFAFTGRWPWWRADGSFVGTDILATLRRSKPAPDGDERLAGGVDGTADGVWASVELRGAGTRRLAWVYAALVTPASMLIFVSDLRRAEFLAAEPLRTIVFATAAIMGVAALWLYFTVMRKKVTWTASANGVRRTGRGTKELHLPWDQLVAATAKQVQMGFETLSLKIEAKDGRSWDLQWMKDKSATDHEFARFAKLVVGQVQRRGGR